MQNTHHPELIAEIAAFCLRNTMAKSTFGQEAMGDPRFVFDLEAGRELRSKTISRVRLYIAGFPASAAQGDSAA